MAMASIGAMTRGELAVLVDWAAAERWNPGLGDAEVAWRDQPESFRALRRDGELVGGASVLGFGSTWGFLGLFIVRDGLRGAGLGGLLWDHLLADLRARLGDPGASIGLDGVEAMQPFYARSGFVPAYRDIRYAGRPSLTADPSVQVVDGSSLTGVALDQVLDYDELHAAGPRRGFMRGWLAMPGLRVATLHEGDRLRGLGALRPCRDGWKFGPVVAEETSYAESIVTSLAAEVPGQLVQLDVPEPNEAARAMAERLGLQESFACARMYRGRVPDLPVQRIVGVTSFEFG